MFDNNFKSVIYKAKLLKDTVADSISNNGILKNARITMTFKCLSNFWRSLEMPLTNCKVELKLMWAKYFVLAVTDADNVGGNSSNVIFTIKDTKLYLAVVTLSAKDNKRLSKLFSKGFERSVYLNEYKTKSENKNTTI